MAYEKHNWSCGDTVTAELLNHLEEGVEDAANGYSISKQVVFNDSVTTEVEQGAAYAYADITPSAPFFNTIDVEFNDTTYTFEGVKDGCTNYGAPYDESTDTFDWSQYPLHIRSCSDSAQASFMTETAGTYTLKITSDAITVTDEFKAAVQAAVGGGKN